MRIERTFNYSPNSLTFTNSCPDLTFIARYTLTHYDPLEFGSKEICEGIARAYDNLEPVQAAIFLRQGSIKRNSHWVCKVKNLPYIIDPTADQYDYPENRSKLKSQIAPWIFTVGGPDPNKYYSMNHAPYILPYRKEPLNPSDWDVLTLTRNPFYSELRCIIL